MIDTLLFQLTRLIDKAVAYTNNKYRQFDRGWQHSVCIPCSWSNRKRSQFVQLVCHASGSKSRLQLSVGL